MDDVYCKLNEFYSDVQKRLSDPKGLNGICRQYNKEQHSYIKSEENYTKFPRSDVQLFIDGFDSEGIFQQVRHHSTPFLPFQENVDKVDPDTLCVRAYTLEQAYVNVSSESSGIDEGDESDEEMDQDESESEEDKESGLEGSSDLDQLESDDNISQDETKKQGLVSESSDEENESDNENLDKDSESSDENDNAIEEAFGPGEIDFEADTFGDLKLDENEESEDTGDDEMQGFEKKVEEEKKKKKKTKNKKKTGAINFDEQLNADIFDQEMESDEELQNALYDEDSDDEEDVEGEGKVATFKDFFDTAESYDKYVKGALKSCNDEDQEEIEADNMEKEMNAESYLEENKVKSTYELDLEKEKVLMGELEQNNIATKPWHLTGEVVKDSRPKDSILEEHLEVTIAAKQKPELTDDLEAYFEKIILERVKNKAFDDPERKIKPVLDPQQFKKKLVLDQDKNTKSLCEIYEEGWAKAQEADKPKIKVNLLTGKEEKSQENPALLEFYSDLDTLDKQLDALYDYHPKPMLNPDIKIINRTPVIAMEEVTPITASDATMLAPQEVFAPVRGELLGKTERTQTDKKRERRKKKSHQHEKAKTEEEKLKKQLKNTSRDGVASHEASVKVVQKAIKKGQVHVLESKINNASTSTKFFEEIQKHVGEKRKRTQADARKKRPRTEISAKKLLL